MHGEVFIPITLFISLAILIAAIAHYRTRENLAMIERGMNPKLHVAPKSPYRYQKWALLLIGAGLGLFLAYILDVFVMRHIDHNNPVAIYFSLIAIGGGLGLLAAHRAEKQWIESQPRTNAD